MHSRLLQVACGADRHQSDQLCTGFAIPPSDTHKARTDAASTHRYILQYSAIADHPHPEHSAAHMHLQWTMILLGWHLARGAHAGQGGNTGTGIVQPVAGTQLLAVAVADSCSLQDYAHRSAGNDTCRPAPPAQSRHARQRLSTSCDFEILDVWGHLSLRARLEYLDTSSASSTACEDTQLYSGCAEARQWHVCVANA